MILKGRRRAIRDLLEEIKQIRAEKLLSAMGRLCKVACEGALVTKVPTTSPRKQKTFFSPWLRVKKRSHCDSARKTIQAEFGTSRGDAELAENTARCYGKGNSDSLLYERQQRPELNGPLLLRASAAPREKAFLLQLRVNH